MYWVWLLLTVQTIGRSAAVELVFVLLLFLICR